MHQDVVEAILNAEDNTSGTSVNIVQTTLLAPAVLAQKVAHQDVVDVLVPALAAGNDETKKVYTQSAAKAAFAAKGELNDKADKPASGAFVNEDNLAAKVVEKANPDMVQGLLSVTDSGSKIKTAFATKVAEVVAEADVKAELEAALLAPAVLAQKVAHQDVVKGILEATRTNGQNQQEKILETGLKNTFAPIDHTHQALNSGQSISPAPQPASAVGLSSLQGLAEDAPVPDAWTNGL